MLYSHPCGPVRPQPQRHADSKISQLVDRVVTRDDYPAFRELFTFYYNPLCRFALRYVRTREKAEEVVSDVLTRLWRNRFQLQELISFESYIYRAVKNQSLDYLKSRLNRDHAYAELSVSQYEIATDDTPETIWMRGDLQRSVDDAIGRLPRQCQMVFRMSRDKGLTYNEISEQLGISVKTVETHMSRALKTLRFALAEYR